MLHSDLKLGFGGGRIGAADMREDNVFALLDRAVELGITFFDTARGYGLSEERIGQWLELGQGPVTVVSKCGYSVEGYEDWTSECIAAGVDLALSKLGQENLDGMILHSCPLETLKREGLMEALEEAKSAGKVRAIGYSGENEALAFAAASGRCDILETSVNLFDQWSLRNVLPKTNAFVIAKRPLANVCWTFMDEPVGAYAHEYWKRMKQLPFGEIFGAAGLTWTEAALRFSAFSPGVGCAITGTSSEANLEANRRILDQGPLPPEVLSQIEAVYVAVGEDWPGEI